MQVTIELPEPLSNVPRDERDLLIRAGLGAAVTARRREIQRELDSALAQIQRFEQRYGVSFERFEAELLPTLDSPQGHEDYNDWFYWHSVAAEQMSLLEALRS